MNQDLDDQKQKQKTSGRMAAAIDLLIDYLLKEYGEEVNPVRISKTKPKDGPHRLRK